jgi:hypothetical protein
MIGSYISDDFQFYFELDEIESLKKTRNTLGGEFVCNKNDGTGLVKMRLQVKVGYDSTTKRVASDITINFQKKTCDVVISKQDFDDWFVFPDEYTVKNGPNWRHGSTNVYIKTKKADDAENFRQRYRLILILL